jgi:hypothetical protein
MEDGNAVVTDLVTDAERHTLDDDDAEQRASLRGYKTTGLPVVAVDDPRFWTVADAARLLGPPDLTEAQVRQLVHLAGLEPKGKRPGGSRRRHVRVYDAAELSTVYAALANVMHQVAA